jgi:hypothetical protein
MNNETHLRTANIIKFQAVTISVSNEESMAQVSGKYSVF